MDDTKANLPLGSQAGFNYQTLPDAMCTRLARSEADWQMPVTDHSRRRGIEHRRDFWDKGWRVDDELGRDWKTLSAEDKFGVDYAMLKSRYGTNFSASEMNILGSYVQNLNAADQEVCKM